jgi:cytochrome c oxidase assembly protein subunit 15
VGRIRISPQRYQQITLAALIALGAITFTGALVRLTDSGMGCPTWPTCEPDAFTPQGATGYHGWIEFGNRLFTGVVSAAVVLAVLGSMFRVPRRADLTRWAWGLVAGVAAQVLVGAVVVLTHVTPIAVMTHFLLSMVLIWNAVVLHHKAGEPLGPRRPRATPALLRAGHVMVWAGVGVLVTGTVVTGSGPHGGDYEAERLGFDISTVALIHAASVWLFLVTVLVVWGMARANGQPEVLGRTNTLLAAIGAQALIGYVQYINGIPVLLVAGHILGSVVVWVCAVRVLLSLTVPVAPADGPGTDPVTQPSTASPHEPAPAAV